MFEQPFYLNYSDPLYEEKLQLFAAAHHGDVDTIDRLLENNKIHVDATDGRENTALFVATEAKKIGAIQALLKHGANANISNEYQVAPLEFAICNCEPEIIKLLVSHGADMYEGRGALQLAYYSGRQEVVQLLLDHGANINEINCEGTSAFQAAIQGGNINLIKPLLGKFDIEAKDKCDNTALFYAVKQGVAELLLDRGARTDVEISDESHCWSRNVAHHAIQECRGEAAKVLLEHGAEVDNVDTFGKTILETALYSVKYCRDTESVEKNPYLVVVRHLVKNSLMSERHLKTINENQELSKFKAKCEKEITAMKRKVILKGINGITFFYGFLMTKDVNKLATIARNEKAIAALNLVKKKFKIYFSLLTYQMRRGLWRNILTSKVKYFFYALAHTEQNKGLPILPKPCVDKIYSYLDSNDLRALIQICDPSNHFDAEICDVQID